MPIRTFEYCSLQYLNMWLQYEMGFCNDLAEGDRKKKLEALSKAAAYFRVARTLHDDDRNVGTERYERVLDIILAEDTMKDGEDLVQRIESVGRKISDNRSLLSLTTKFLWLRFKRPVLIFDSQARIALGTKEKDLETFYLLIFNI